MIKLINISKFPACLLDSLGFVLLRFVKVIEVLGCEKE